MRTTIAILSCCVVALLFGIVGYAIGVHETQEEAIANKAGHWEWLDNSMGTRFKQFAWGPGVD